DPFVDLGCFARLTDLFRLEQFDLVLSLTPKGGLLAMLAGRISRTPVRVHIFTGQVWATRSGVLRAVLKAADRLIAACATRALVDSESQREFLIREGIIEASKVHVLANGSVSGVDLRRFRP